MPQATPQVGETWTRDSKPYLVLEATSARVSVLDPLSMNVYSCNPASFLHIWQPTEQAQAQAQAQALPEAFRCSVSGCGRTPTHQRPTSERVCDDHLLVPGFPRGCCPLCALSNNHIVTQAGAFVVHECRRCQSHWTVVRTVDPETLLEIQATARDLEDLGLNCYIFASGAFAHSVRQMAEVTVNSEVPVDGPQHLVGIPVKMSGLLTSGEALLVAVNVSLPPVPLLMSADKISAGQVWRFKDTVEEITVSAVHRDRIHVHTTQGTFAFSREEFERIAEGPFHGKSLGGQTLQTSFTVPSIGSRWQCSSGVTVVVRGIHTDKSGFVVETSSGTYPLSAFLAGHSRVELPEPEEFHGLEHLYQGRLGYAKGNNWAVKVVRRGWDHRYFLELHTLTDPLPVRIDPGLFEALFTPVPIDPWIHPGEEWAVSDSTESLHIVRADWEKGEVEIETALPSRRSVKDLQWFTGTHRKVRRPSIYERLLEDVL